MGAVDRWLKTSSPMGKVFMAISITTGLIVVNKYFYAPYARKNRALRAEEWANMIIEQEEAMKESTERQY